MATRLKTIEYGFDVTNLTDASVAGSNRTIYIPESGTKTFRSVIVRWTADDIVTATGGTITEFRTGLQLGAVGYTTITNTNDIDNSGENLSIEITADFTSHFNTNWTGTSMACGIQVYCDQSTGTTLGMNNAVMTLEITYEYDDTSTAQVKTVYIPLDAPTGALATSKPAAIATIPALDTYLPERNKVYRDIRIVVQGNEHRNALTTDHTLSLEIDSAGATTTSGYEGALATDRWFRYVWPPTSFTTNATHSFYIWASVARCNHLQIYAIVTYEFDYGGPATTAWAATTSKSLNDRIYGTANDGKDVVFICTTAGTTGSSQPTWNVDAGDTTTDGSVTWTVLSVMNSLIVPMQVDSPMGGVTSSDYQRATYELSIQEPAPIVDNYCGIFYFWEQVGPIGGLNIKVGGGSFIAYTDTAQVLAGVNGAMRRCESDLTLARGKNTLQSDIYRTDTADLGWTVSAFWIINYSSPQYKDGVGSHNHTVRWNIANFSTINSAIELVTSAVAPNLPESNYYLGPVGVELMYLGDNTIAGGNHIVQTERLSSGEGGVKWEMISTGIGSTDAEVGIHYHYAHTDKVFKRWTADAGPNRLDIETSRRWRVGYGNQMAAFTHLDILLNYHSIPFTISGNVTGFAGDGSAIPVKIHRVENDELILQATTAAGGSYTATWFDNTDEVYAVAREDDTHVGRSANETAT